MKSMTTKKRFCLQCDNGTALEFGARDIRGDIDGVAYFVPAVQGWHCPVCGDIEFIQDDDSSERLSAAMEAAATTARTQRAQTLRATRKKLKLSQAEAGVLFGGGVSAFSEYEHGKTQPHKSTVLLFQLLDHHPELLKELRPA